jgi:hypothetical protein
MSWAGLASNQCVSCNNLQDAVNTGVFALKSTIPSSTKQITKSEAESYVYCSVGGGKSSNQLVVKSNLTSTVYQYNFGDDGGTSGTACGLSASSTAYASTNSPVSGTTFYSDSGLTTIFPMSGYSGLFVKYKLTTDSTYMRARFDLATSTINNTPVSC